MVYRVPAGQDYMLSATGADVATFGELRDATGFARGLQEQVTRLQVLGVMFSQSFDFRVKAMTYTDNGIRYTRVVMDEENEEVNTDVEYETAPKELES